MFQFFLEKICCFFRSCTDFCFSSNFSAQASGLPLLDPFLSKTSNFTGGVNFAVAGATALDPDFFTTRNIGTLWTSLSLDTQIFWFLEYKTKFCATYTGGIAKFHSYMIY